MKQVLSQEVCVLFKGLRPFKESNPFQRVVFFHMLAYVKTLAQKSRPSPVTEKSENGPMSIRPTSHSLFDWWQTSDQACGCGKNSHIAQEKILNGVYKRELTPNLAQCVLGLWIELDPMQSCASLSGPRADNIVQVGFGLGRDKWYQRSRSKPFACMTPLPLSCMVVVEPSQGRPWA